MSTKTSPAIAACSDAARFVNSVPQTATSAENSGTADSVHAGAITGDTNTRRRTCPTLRETRGLRRADDLIASGKVEQALDRLRKLVSDVPGATRGYLKMASLLRQKRRASEALDVLRAAIAQNPTVLAPREVLAELCLEVGRWEEAIAQSRALLHYAPRSLFARDVLSAAYLQRGLLDRALRVTDEMVSLDPTDPANHFKRGVLLQQKGLLGGAVRAFLRVLEMDPDSEAAEESRAAVEMLDCCQLRQIVMLAVEDIPFRLRLRHNCVEAITLRGYLLSDRGIVALQQMRFDELPTPPIGWRQYYYH